MVEFGSGKPRPWCIVELGSDDPQPQYKICSYVPRICGNPTTSIFCKYKYHESEIIMNRYELTFCLKDGSKIKCCTGYIEEEYLIKTNKEVMKWKKRNIIKNGNIKVEFLSEDIKKIKYKALIEEDE